jgi:hypothetical protein
MSQSTTVPPTQAATPTRPWTVEVLADFFGYHLWVDGTRFYIPKERFDAVIVALAAVKERESAGSDSDWLDELHQSIRQAPGE